MDEIDLRCLKRKELQALCKKHKIPANLTNLEMANKLTELFKEKKMPSTGGPIIKQDEVVSETKSNNVVVNTKVKKVRFSPENELIEFTRSCVGKRTRRSSVLSKPTKLSVVESVNNVELLSCRMLLRGTKLTENVKSANKRGRKRAMVDDKADNKAPFNVDDENYITNVMEVPGRVTRSRRQKLGIVSTQEEERGKKVGNCDGNAHALVSVGNDESGAIKRGPLRSRRVVDDGKIEIDVITKASNYGKGKEEVLDVNAIADEKLKGKSQNLSRRSNRRANTADYIKMVVEGSQVDTEGEVEPIGKLQPVIQNQKAVKVKLRRKRRKSVFPPHEQLSNDELKMKNQGYGPRSSVLQVTTGEVPKDDKEVPQPGGVVRRLNHNNTDLRTYSAAENLDTDRKDETVFQNQETVKVGLRTSTRKSVFPSYDQLQVETAGGVRKDDKDVPKPRGVLRRSRNSKLDPKPVSTDENLNAVAVEKSDSGKHVNQPCVTAVDIPPQKNTRRSKRNASNSLEISDEFGLDAIIQQKNEAVKKKKVHISKEDVVSDDSSPSTLSMRKLSKTEIAATSVIKVSDERKLPCMLEESNLSQVSPKEGVLEVRESLSMRLSVPNVAGNMNQASLIRKLSAGNISIDMSLTSATISNQEIKENCILDSAKSPKMESTNDIALAKTTKCEKETPDRSEEMAHLSLEIPDNNDVATQVISHTDFFSFHDITNCEEVMEASDFSKNVVSFETKSLPDTIIITDQTDAKSNLEVIEANANERMEPNSDLLEVKGVYIQENLNHVEPVNIHDITSLLDGHLYNMDPSRESNISSEKMNQDRAEKIGEAGASELEARFDSTYSKSALECKGPSSPKISGVPDDGFRAEEDETCSEEREKGPLNLFSCERGVGNRPDVGQSIMDSGGKGTVHDFLTVPPSPVSSVNFSNVTLVKGLEVDSTVDEGEASHKGGFLELTKSNKVGCLTDHMCASEKEREFSLDGGGSPSIRPLGSVDTVFDLCQKDERQDVAAETGEQKLVEDFKTNMSGDKMPMCRTIRNDEHETFNHKSSNNDPYEPEQPRRLKVEAIATVDTFQETESLSHGIEVSGNAMSIFSNNSSKTEFNSESAENTNSGSVNQLRIYVATLADNEKCTGEKEDSVDAQTADMDIFVDSSINNLESKSSCERKHHDIKVTEIQYQDLLACNTMTKAGGEPSDEELGQNRQENKLESIGTPMDSASLGKPNESLVKTTMHQGIFGTCSFIEREDNELQLLFATPINFEASCMVDETSGPQSILNSASCKEGFFPVEENMVTETKFDDKIDGGRGVEFENVISESLVLAANNQKASNTGFLPGKEEYDLQLLFATPHKIEVSCKVDEMSCSERKIEDSSCMEKAYSTMQEVSHKQVGRSGSEPINNLSPEKSEVLKDEGVMVEDSGLVKGLEVSSAVFPLAKCDSHEAYEKNRAENTVERVKETSSITEENIFSIGKKFLEEEATDNDRESAELSFRTSSSLKNLDEIGCNKLLDSDFSQYLTCASEGAHSKSLDDMSEDGALALGLFDTDIQKCIIPENNHYFPAYSQDSNVMNESSVATPLESTILEVENNESFHNDIDDATDKVPKLLLRDSGEDDEATEMKDKVLNMDEDGASAPNKVVDNPKFYDKIPYELQNNNESETVKSYSASPIYQREAVILACNDEKLEDETVVNMRSADNTVQLTENGSNVMEAESNLFSSLELCLLAGDRYTIGNSEGEPPNLNFESVHAKFGKVVDESSTAKNKNNVPQLPFREVVDFCDESLKENDTTETIQEYIDRKEAPNKTESCCKVNETPAYERNLEDTFFKENKQKVSPQKVGEAGSELINNSSFEKSVAPNDESTRVDDLNLVKGIEVAHETSDENWAEKTVIRVEGSSSMSEENIFSTSHIFHDEKEKQNNQELAEIDTTTESPVRNFDEVRYHDKLLDNDMSENLTCGSGAHLRSGEKIAQNSDVAFCLTNGDSFAAFSQGRDILDTLIDDFIESTTSAVAKGGCLPRKSDLVTDKGNIPCLLSNAASEDDDSKDLLLETDRPKSSHKIIRDLQTNSESDITKSDSVGYSLHTEAHVLTHSDENLEEETVLTLQNVDSIAPAAADDDKSGQKFLRFNWESDCDNDDNDVEENSTAKKVKQQVSVPALHFQEKVIEYIDSESFKLVDIDNGDEAESKEVEKGAAPSPTHAASITDEGRVLMESQEDNDSDNMHMSVLKQFSTAKKNARTVLIHGTPSKPLMMADMKENAPTKNNSQIGDITMMRAPKRRALQDIKWK